jgi:hypothetical protein
VFAPRQAGDMLAAPVRMESEFEFFGTPYDYQPLLFYIAEPLFFRSLVLPPIKTKSHGHNEQVRANLQLTFTWPI